MMLIDLPQWLLPYFYYRNSYSFIAFSSHSLHFAKILIAVPAIAYARNSCVVVGVASFVLFNLLRFLCRLFLCLMVRLLLPLLMLALMLLLLLLLPLEINDFLRFKKWAHISLFRNFVFALLFMNEYCLSPCCYYWGFDSLTAVLWWFKISSS